MGRAGKGPGGEGRQSAVTECRAALPAPLPGVWERSRARGRGPGAWGRGSAGFWTSRAARGARWPPELGAEPGARSPERAATRSLCAGRQPRPRQPGSRGARLAMEPSHKDAETAAAAAAVAAADRGASSSSGVVVQVREKKGPLRAAIPYMPFPVAVICLFLNTFVPGLGKTRWPRPRRPGALAREDSRGGVEEGPSGGVHRRRQLRRRSQRPLAGGRVAWSGCREGGAAQGSLTRLAPSRTWEPGDSAPKS